MGLVFSLLETREVFEKIVFLAVGANLVWRYLLVAVVLDESLQLLYPIVFKFNILFSLSVDSIISIKFFLKLNNCFVPLVKPTC